MTLGFRGLGLPVSDCAVRSPESFYLLRCPEFRRFGEPAGLGDFHPLNLTFYWIPSVTLGMRGLCFPVSDCAVRSRERIYCIPKVTLGIRGLGAGLLALPGAPKVRRPCGPG